jgi:tRNA threonylcarbamoyl adenosine modification protein YeaZ
MEPSHPIWQRDGALVLAIETSNPSAWSPGCTWSPGVALARCAASAGVQLVDQEPLDATRPQHDDLASAIERVTRRAGVQPRELRCVAVSLGPGGFTNTRVAVVTACMLAEVSGAQLVGVPSAWVVAQRVVRDGTVFGVALASKREDAHVTRFDGSGVAQGEGAIVDARGLRSLGLARLVADQFLPATMREACAQAGITILAPTFEPMACAEAALLCAAVDPVLLRPIYPREPEAVTKWRALHAKDSAKHPG